MARAAFSLERALAVGRYCASVCTYTYVVLPDYTIDSIVKGLETDLINTFPADSPRCAVYNIVDSFHGCF